MGYTLIMNEELENNNDEISEAEKTDLKQQINTVTPLSKYLAMALFIILPFIGGWIGYTYAPEKIVEVEKIIIQEVKDENEVTKNSNSIKDSFYNESIQCNQLSEDLLPVNYNKDWITYSNKELGFSFMHPEGWEVSDIKSSNSSTYKFHTIYSLEDDEVVQTHSLTITNPDEVFAQGDKINLNARVGLQIAVPEKQKIQSLNPILCANQHQGRLSHDFNSEEFIYCIDDEFEINNIKSLMQTDSEYQVGLGGIFSSREYYMLNEGSIFNFYSPFSGGIEQFEETPCEITDRVFNIDLIARTIKFN